MPDTQYVKLTPEQRAKVAEVRDLIFAITDDNGTFDYKYTATQRTFTLTVGFERKTSVSNMVQAAERFANAPGLLANACQRLLDADAAVSCE